jgi:hypothetical protein
MRRCAVCENLVELLLLLGFHFADIDDVVQSSENVANKFEVEGRPTELVDFCKNLIIDLEVD